MSLNRFYRSLAEAKKPKGVLVSEGGEVFEIELALFKDVFKEVTGKDPKKADIKFHREEEPLEIPNVSRMRRVLFRVKNRGHIIPPAKKRRIGKLGWREGEAPQRVPVPLRVGVWKVIKQVWKDHPNWRFAVDEYGNAVGDNRPFKRVDDEDYADHIIWRKALLGLMRNKTSFHTLSVLSPDWKELQVLENPKVQKFLVDVKLARKSKGLVKMTGSGKSTPDARMAKDVIRWIATDKLLYPELLASHLFHIATPAPIRVAGLSSPAEAEARNKKLVIVPSADAFNLMPDFWSWTGGPLKKLRALEKAIEKAVKNKEYVEDQLAEVEEILLDPGVKGRAALVTKRNDLSSRLNNILNLIGRADSKGRAINPRTKGHIATGVLSIIKSIQNLLSTIGKGLQIEGPKYGTGKVNARGQKDGTGFTTSMPSLYKNFDKKLPKGNRAERLSALFDPKTKGSPLATRDKLYGKMFQPTRASGAKALAKQLSFVIEKLKGSIKSRDEAAMADGVRKVDDLGKRLFDAKMAEAAKFSRSARTRMKQKASENRGVAPAWSFYKKAVEEYRSVVTIFNRLEAINVPKLPSELFGKKEKQDDLFDKALYTKWAKEAMDKIEALEKGAKKAFDAYVKVALAATIGGRVDPKEIKRAEDKAMVKLDAEWESLWQGS